MRGGEGVRRGSTAKPAERKSCKGSCGEKTRTSALNYSQLA